MKLMVREMLDPYLPKKMFVEEMGRPTLSALGDAIAKICPGLGQRETVMSILSVIGQLIHTIHLNEIFNAEEDFGLPMPNLAEMVEHIVAFSAGGILAVAEGKNRKNDGE
jgi:hypothetical protein